MKIKNIKYWCLIALFYSCTNPSEKKPTNKNPEPSPIAEETAKNRIPVKIRPLTDQEFQDSTKKYFTILNKETDDFNNITWYKPKSFVHYNNSNKLSLYLGITSGISYLRLKMSYQGDDWIFFEQALLNYDGNTLNIPFNRYDNKKTDNDADYVWEWIDVNVEDDMLPFLEEFAKSPNAKMRLSGKYYKDRNITKAEKKEILNIITAYNKHNYYSKLKIDK